MKKFFICLVSLSMLCVEEIHAYKVDVKENWPSPTPWIKDRFTDFLDSMPHNARVVEVGVQDGAYAACILRKTNPIQLFLVDCWEHQDPLIYDDPEANVSNEMQEIIYRETKQRFAHDPRVVIIRLYSEQAAMNFEDESLDWVYIDANHSYEAVKKDLMLWWPKIKKNGFLSGHDYIKRDSWGVVQAVNEFLNSYDLYFEYLTTGNNYESWAIQKPSN